jgi:hypothetical protein
MTQDFVNEAQSLLDRADRSQKILDDSLNRIVELRDLIERMIEAEPRLLKKFKSEIDKLND